MTVLHERWVHVSEGVDMPERTACRNCPDEIERLTSALAAEQGYDERDFDWVHVYRCADGTVLANPKCDNGGEDGTGGWDDGTWAEPVGCA